MEGKLIIFTGITFLHDLFTAVWTGGLIVTGIAVLPALKRVFGMSPQTRAVMQALQSKLRVLVYISIAGLIITGVLMSRRSPHFRGLLSWGNTYSAVLALKHLLVLAMVGIALVRSLAFGHAPASPAHGRGSPASTGATQVPVSTWERVSMRLLLFNMALGIVVLLLSAASSVLSVAAGRLPG